jgi:hypothetical protein
MSWQIWRSKHKFQLQLTAFLMMLIAPVPLFLAAQRGDNGWIWFWLCIIILANLLVMLVK